MNLWHGFSELIIQMQAMQIGNINLYWKLKTLFYNPFWYGVPKRSELCVLHSLCHNILISNL